MCYLKFNIPFKIGEVIHNDGFYMARQRLYPRKKVSEYDQEIQQSQTADQPTQTPRKSCGTLTVTRHPKDNLNKATRSLFLVKMIAKLVKDIM